MPTSDLREILQSSVRLVNRSLNQSRKAEATWGLESKSLTEFSQRYSRAAYNKNMTRGELVSELSAISQYFRGEDRTQAQLRDRWIKYSQHLLGAYIDLSKGIVVNEQEAEKIMREYLRDKGVKDVGKISRRDLPGRFAANVPKEFVTNFSRVMRSLREEPQFRSLPSKIYIQLMREYVNEYRHHPDYSFDDWMAWLTDRAAYLLIQYEREFSGRVTFGGEF